MAVEKDANFIGRDVYIATHSRRQCSAGTLTDLPVIGFDTKGIVGTGQSFKP